MGGNVSPSASEGKPSLREINRNESAANDVIEEGSLFGAAAVGSGLLARPGLFLGLGGRPLSGFLREDTVPPFGVLVGGTRVDRVAVHWMAPDQNNGNSGMGRE
jgi:hypothetical protein